MDARLRALERQALAGDVDALRAYLGQVARHRPLTELEQAALAGERKGRAALAWMATRGLSPGTRTGRPLAGVAEDVYDFLEYHADFDEYETASPFDFTDLTTIFSRYLNHLRASIIKHLLKGDYEPSAAAKGFLWLVQGAIQHLRNLPSPDRLVVKVNKSAKDTIAKDLVVRFEQSLITGALDELVLAVDRSRKSSWC